MIRGLRITTIVICIIAVLLYGGVSVYTEMREDSQEPEISMEEKEITVSTEEGEKAVFSGIKAVDERDGDVSDSLVIESMSNFIEKGVRDMTIAAFDQSGNVAKTVRRVRYSDYHSPKITLKKPFRVSVNKIGSLSSAVNAWDCLDGDISSSVQLTSEAIGSDVEPGRYQIHIMVPNSAGDVTEMDLPAELYDPKDKVGTREVILTEYLVYTKVGQPIDSDKYLWGISEEGMRYKWDSEEPPIVGKESVGINDAVDYSTPGIYEITYTIADAEGIPDSVKQFVVVE